MAVKGYRYLFGIHMGVCRGPVDEVVEIRAGDRTAWTGSVTSNQHINIEAYDLFGGEDGEGGIQGDLCVMMGNDNQVACPGLVSMLASQGFSSSSINVYNLNVVSTASGTNGRAEFGLRANGTAYKIENGVTIELPGMWVNGAPMPEGSDFASFYEGYWLVADQGGDAGPYPTPQSNVGYAPDPHNLANGVRIWVDPVDAYPSTVYTIGRYEIRAISGVVVAGFDVTLNSGPL